MLFHNTNVGMHTYFTWPVLMYTENSAPFLMRLALQVWCLTTPPPRITLQRQRKLHHTLSAKFLNYTLVLQHLPNNTRCSRWETYMSRISE
jgi:hypothetical protein